jgi:type I restriction enzyme M protein
LTDVVAKLWGFCDYLRDDGMNYGLYIEQLTYLLFLKMAFEKGIKLPKDCNWNELIEYSGSELLEKYVILLKKLSKEKAFLGDIFASSNSAFTNPRNLKQLLNDLNEIEWSSTKIDIKAAAYEGLLEKYAATEKGAGQYFTPRPLIRAIIKCVKPDFVNYPEYTIHDPACGTSGFLIEAFEWIMNETEKGSKLKINDRERLIKKTFSGGDNVVTTRRLSLMNCYLHEIEAEIYYGNSLSQGPHVNKRYNLVLTNPPFGSSGKGGVPDRDDFNFPSANKQLNFVQHVMTILKPTGKCAMVVPDGVLFGNDGVGLREQLLKEFCLDTILILPEGTFVPYADAKANVLFFTKGKSTKDVWIYNLRTNIQKIRKKVPLTEELFNDFIKCYSQKNRKETERFQKRSFEQIEDNKFNLYFKFVKDDSLIDLDTLEQPDILAKDISENLKIAYESTKDIIKNL